MAGVRVAIDAALGGIARPVRLYALAEDGTLVSLPWAPPGTAENDVPRAEAALLSARPALPSFAPEEFFFTFANGASGTLRYSGFYLDLGGRGLVSTLMLPLDYDGGAGVLALDLAHAIDWRRFASSIAAPLTAGVVELPSSTSATWSALAQALPDEAPVELRRVLERAVSSSPPPDPDAPMTHAVVADAGAVAAFHVTERMWLLTFFPRTAPSFPAAATALLGVLLVVLLVGFEAHRRKAEREADRAARALAEKQNLLNTMQVPLMVVDPNTDVVVSSNAAAEAVGIRRGARFADLVSPDPRARAHYEHTQVASADPRRAYGIPIRVDGTSGQTERFAIVRSVAVTAPIEALEADERHRLGILLLVDPRVDLTLLVDDVEAAAHRDERKRLAGLLSHGLDALVQALQRSLAAPGPDAAGLSTWLAEYLERRIHVTAWLLDHWDQPPPAHDAVVDAAQAVETLASLERVFTAVRHDAHARSRLGWANGPLSAAGHGRDTAIVTEIDWPAEFEMTLPIRGGLGFFLTEALSNAMRHGAPGSAPTVSMRCDRVRKELAVTIANRAREAGRDTGSPYGGLSLLTGMARLFGWKEFAAEPRGDTFVVSWRAALTRRDRPGTPD
jgi:PAS domain-containing protein